MQSYLNLFIHNTYSIHLFLCHDKFIHNFQGHISQNCVYPLHMDTDKLYGHFLCVQGFCTCRIVCIGSTPVSKKSMSLQNKTKKLLSLHLQCTTYPHILDH